MAKKTVTPLPKFADLARAIATTVNPTTFPLDYVTDFLVDNRALGYRAAPIGGRDSNFEPLAELIVQHDLEQALAAFMQSEDMLGQVLDQLFPKRETLKLTTGQGMFAFPMLLRAVRANLPGSLDNAERVAFATIVAELLALALQPLNLILPFTGVVGLSYHSKLIPTPKMVKDALRVQRVATILESMKLDAEIGKVKVISAAALYAVLAPIFRRNGRLLLTTVMQDMEVDTTFLLLGMYVRRDPALPSVLIDNPDLAALATNLTYVYIALKEPLVEYKLPDWALKTAIADSTLRLRALQRFSTEHLSTMKEWFSHITLYDAPGQSVRGILFTKNVSAELRTQVTIFNQVETANNPVWTQVPFPPAEVRVDPLLQGLYAAQMNSQHMTGSEASVAAYLNPMDETVVVRSPDTSEEELMYYAAAYSRSLCITVDDAQGYSLAYLFPDIEQNYESKAIVLGTRVLTVDAGEALIYSGVRENLSSGSVPVRIQTVPDTVRDRLLLSNPDGFTTNLGTPFSISFVIKGAAGSKDPVTLSMEATLAELLALPGTMRLSLTNQPAAQKLLASHVELMLAMASSVDPTSSAGEIAANRAATHMSQLLLAVATSPAGRALLRTVFIRMMSSVPAGAKRDHVRGQLAQAKISYRLALMFGARLLETFEYLEPKHTQGMLDLIRGTHLENFMLGTVPNLADLVIG